MQHSLNELTRRDFFVCLGIWLSLELLAFVLLPTLKLVQMGDRTQLWLGSSLVLGIGGALLLAMGARLVALAPAGSNRPQRILRRVVGLLANWLGLIGIAFPLFTASVELFITLFATLAGQSSS